MCFSYFRFLFCMAFHGSWCTMSLFEIRITNIVFNGLSILSFIFGVTALFLNLCYHCHYKVKYLATKPLEKIFLLALIACCILELVDSFQWLVLLDSLDSLVGCTVLGAIREYALICFLVMLLCIGAHLLILTKPPKCLSVIEEHKRKRYQILQVVYFIATFFIPVLFVPLSFIKITYGKDTFLCWVIHNCNASHTSNITEHLFAYYIWAVLVWVFAVTAVSVAFYRYCTHQPTIRHKLKSSTEMAVIILILTLFIIAVAVNTAIFIQTQIKRRSSFPLTLLISVMIPLMTMIFTLLLIIRQLMIIKAESQRIIAVTNVSAVTYDSFGSMAPTYHSLPVED